MRRPLFYAEGRDEIGAAHRPNGAGAPEGQPRRLIPLGIRYMAAAAFFFSVMSVMVKAVGQRLPTQQVVLVRAAITLGLTWALLRRAGTPVWGHDRRLLITRGVLGFIGLSAFYYAYIHLPLASATVIQYTNPIFAAVIAAWWLKERVGAADLALALASLAGVVLVARPAFLFGGAAASLDPLAVGIALAGAVAAALAYVTVRRLRTSEEPLVIIFYFALISVVLSLPIAAPDAVWPTPAEWAALIGVGLTAQLGQICLTEGLHRETAGRATAVGYMQIVFAAVWGALFFSEYPGLGTIAGAVLIVASTIALARRSGSGRA